MPTRRMALLGTLLAASVTRRARADGPAIGDISFVIPYASGGGFDSYVRAVIPAFEKRVGSRVLPDNVDGAGGAKAAVMLSRAKPDGTTISVVNIPGALILEQQGDLGLDLAKLSWLGNMGRDAYGLMVPAGSPLRSIEDMRVLGRARPVKFTCVGPAGTAYSATRIGAKLLDIPARVIPGYKGTSDYVVAAIRGDGDAAVASLTSLTQFLASGMVRVLATFERSSSLPGVPDATALGVPELADIVQLRPVAGPPGLPAPIAQTLSAALVAALQDPAVVAWARRNGANLQPDDAAATAAMLAQQAQFIARWKGYLAS